MNLKIFQIVGGMSAEQRKVLLFFWTSVKYLPVEGFGGLASRLCIYKTSESHNRLPSSHTCFYRLSFPPYPSLVLMQDHLRIITQEHVGCGFGTWWIIDIIIAHKRYVCRFCTDHRLSVAVFFPPSLWCYKLLPLFCFSIEVCNFFCFFSSRLFMSMQDI